MQEACNYACMDGEFSAYLAAKRSAWAFSAAAKNCSISAAAGILALDSKWNAAAVLVVVVAGVLLQRLRFCPNLVA